MKNLFTSQLLLLFVLLASCSNASEQNYYGESDYDQYPSQQINAQEGNYSQQAPQGNYQQVNAQGNYQNSYKGYNQNMNSKGGGKKTINIPNNQTGQPMFTMQIPTNWKSSNTGFTGPNNIRGAEVGTEQGNNRLMPVNQTINKTKQEMQQEGMQVTRSYPVPSVAAARKRMDDQMWKSGPMQTTFDVIGIEGTKDGQPVFAMLTIMNNQSQFHRYSQREFAIFTSDKNVFEQGKNDFINAYESLNFVPQYIAQYNQSEKQKIQGMQRSYASRSRSNQNAFEAQNKAMQDAFGSVNQGSMNGYNSRSTSMATGHSNYIHEGINGGSTVTGPNGNTYQMDGQGQQTWMNQNGEYIHSDDPNWDPNLNPNLNNTDWYNAPNRQGGGY